MSAKGITLDQVPLDAKSNEIKAIPQVLELIVVRSSVITIDAMGAQLGIVKAITERCSDVVNCLKGNQAKLNKAVCEFVENQLDENFEASVHETLHESSNGNGKEGWIQGPAFNSKYRKISLSKRNGSV